MRYPATPTTAFSQISQPLRWSYAVLAIALLSACNSLAPPQVNPEIEPIRFLLSFDDGPSASTSDNPTEQILDTLANNPTQPGIKALFFVQTRAAAAGGSAQGQALLRRQQREGHLLGFHTATPGHSNHRFLSPAALEQSLKDGVGDLTAIRETLKKPLFREITTLYPAWLLGCFFENGLFQTIPRLPMACPTPNASDCHCHTFCWVWLVAIRGVFK